MMKIVSVAQSAAFWLFIAWAAQQVGTRAYYAIVRGTLPPRKGDDKISVTIRIGVTILFGALFWGLWQSVQLHGLRF